MLCPLFECATKQKTQFFICSKKMVAMWTCGDVFKTCYFILREAPAQFWICGSLQVLIDISIFIQVFMYRSLVPKAAFSQQLCIEQVIKFATYFFFHVNEGPFFIYTCSMPVAFVYEHICGFLSLDTTVSCWDCILYAPAPPHYRFSTEVQILQGSVAWSSSQLVSLSIQLSSFHHDICGLNFCQSFQDKIAVGCKQA